MKSGYNFTARTNQKQKKAKLSGAEIRSFNKKAVAVKGQLFFISLFCSRLQCGDTRERLRRLKVW